MSRMISWETKRLLMAEIDNEKDGGASPTTLASALDSVLQGYNPDLNDRFDMGSFEAELRQLVAEHGPEALAAGFVSDSDWIRRSSRLSHAMRRPQRRGIP